MEQDAERITMKTALTPLAFATLLSASSTFAQNAADARRGAQRSADQVKGTRPEWERCQLVAIAALLLAPFLAQAEDAQARLMRKIHRDLYQQHELCVLQARVALALPQERAQEKAQARSELAACTVEGKIDVENANSMVAQWFKTKPTPAAMATWRTTWLAAYDAANLRVDDTDAIYLRRAINTLKLTDKASTKFQTAVLGAPLK